MTRGLGTFCCFLNMLPQSACPGQEQLGGISTGGWIALSLFIGMFFGSVTTILVESWRRRRELRYMDKVTNNMQPLYPPLVMLAHKYMTSRAGCTSHNRDTQYRPDISCGHGLVYSCPDNVLRCTADQLVPCRALLYVSPWL
jgi:hypothetical protein